MQPKEAVTYLTDVPILRIRVVEFAWLVASCQFRAQEMCKAVQVLPPCHHHLLN